jgi:hypothetical protein
MVRVNPAPLSGELEFTNWFSVLLYEIDEIGENPLQKPEDGPAGVAQM